MPRRRSRHDRRRRPDRPRARLLPRLDDPRAAQDRRRARRGRSPHVGEIVEKSAPVNEVVDDINANLDAGVDALEGLLVKKAGLDDAVGLVEGLYPGAAAAGLRDFPESTTITPPRIGEVYTQGHADARAARPRGADRRRPARRARCCATSRAAASRRALLYPDGPPARARRSCRARRSSAPTRRSSTSSARTSARRASGSRPTSPDARRSTRADPRAIRVRARDERRGRDRVARAARPRGADHRRRPQPAADDEAAARQPRAPDRHQRPHRARLHPRGRAARSGSAR